MNDHTHLSIEAERAAFEVWVIRLAPEHRLTRKENGEFEDYAHEAHFETWLAARRAPTAVPEQPAELPPLPAPQAYQPNGREPTAYTAEQVRHAQREAYSTGRQSLSASCSSMIAMANRLRNKRDAEIAELRAALAAQQPAGAAAELPPIDYDRDMNRTYIPLPGGWEIQTKGKGSTFRIAHIPSKTRWMVLADELHEPLEALARDMRNALADRRQRKEAGEDRTYMTDEQAEKWAWNQVRRDVGTEGWTAGDSCNYYGFFLWGWRYRAQYERQRKVAQEGEQPTKGEGA